MAHLGVAGDCCTAGFQACITTSVHQIAADLRRPEVGSTGPKPEIPFPRAGQVAYINDSCRRGLPKPPGRSGSKSAVGRHSLTYFLSHITQLSPVGAPHTRVCASNSLGG
jgi:hypothetical protein